jgi:hypothetical protein
MKIISHHLRKTTRMQVALFWLLTCSVCIVVEGHTQAPYEAPVSIVNVEKGWAGNSVNTVIFRRNSLVTFAGTQFISYYNQDGYVVIGKRKTGDTHWQLKQTHLKGNIKDAHNSISIAVDGDGYLHLAWDHHNNALRYCKSQQPLSLELTENMPMTGSAESTVTYPEFHKLPDGNLLFFYRDGGSGRGNLVLNKYDKSSRRWTQLHANLVDGEGERNAYWQTWVDDQGTIHVSWVWRESPDVASNHDMAYARSKDGGITWQKSTGEPYKIPVNAASAEYACKIPQASELINQTSMSADAEGNPYIATYWREAGSQVPQYHLVYHTGKGWVTKAFDFRTTPFSLSGVGSKSIPISRPQLFVKGAGARAQVLLLFRDTERGSKISVARMAPANSAACSLQDILGTSVGSWEPTFDTDLWKTQGIISLFVQRTLQADGEGLTNIPAQMIQVLDWKPHWND